MRKTLIIVAVIVVVLGVGIFAYLRFFANRPSIVVTGSQPTLPSSGSIPATIPTQTATSTSVTNVAPRLVEISKTPVASGEIALDIPPANASSSPDIAVQYIDQQSGNIYSYSLLNNVLTRISNKTIPGIRNAVWFPDGSNAIVQYLSGDTLSTVNTYVLPANSDATGNGGFFLPQDLSGIGVSSSSILTLASGVNGSVGSVSKLDGTSPKQIFSTPLSMVRASFNGTSYLVYTKPSSTLPGYAYTVNKKGYFARVVGPFNGLTALPSPSGDWVFVSYSSNGVMSSILVNTRSLAQIKLPVSTIADKCVWTQDESAIYCGVPNNPATSYAYPDDWYQGAVHFSDDIWKIDVSGRFAQLVLDFTRQTGGSLDAESLSVDPNDQLLVFKNKNDGTLWSYQL